MCRRAGRVFKKVDQEGIGVNYQNRSMFIKICEYIDSVAEAGTLFRCGVKKESTDLVVELDLLDISTDE